MEHIVFGRTGIKVGRTGFGAIPIQRVSFEESTALLRHAYENGITVYDTANGYTTSEERIGLALSHVRENIVLCTKSGADKPERIAANIENSLRMLKTDHIDVFQFHNPSFVPRPGGEDGLYDCLLDLKQKGAVRSIGISYHSAELAAEAVRSGLFDVLQFPLSYLSSKEELTLIDLCRDNNVGLLAMKGLSGGLITKAKAAFAFLRRYENVVPIWGLQKISELDEFIKYENDPPELDGEMLKLIEDDKKQLSGSFCRACGYCLPCEAGVPIPMAARMSLLLRRMIKENFLTPEWRSNMKNIDNCTGCGNCKARCPYGIDVPVLLKQQQEAYFKEVGE